MRTLMLAFGLFSGMAAAAGPVTAPVRAAGHWLVDDQGRVVTFHGFNIMWKAAPWYPERFSEQDAAFLADNGFNVARLGLLWKGIEPQPGAYDLTPLQKQGELDAMLSRYGIRTIVDSHQDFWKNAGPDWASPSPLFPVNFQNFWDDGAAADGVGVQARFHAWWTLIATFFESRVNVLGYDTFNEPQPGIASGCSPMLEPCPTFEMGPLTDFYRRNFAAVRAVDAHHILFPEGVTQSGVIQPSLPDFDDQQWAYNAHIYCPSFTADTDIPVACGAFEQNGIRNYIDYTKNLDIPFVMTEFSSTSADSMNVRMVDEMTDDFITWTAWAYYNDSGGGIGTQGVLIDDAQPGSEANAKADKMDAFVVPYAQAIAGTPVAQAFDRTSKTYTLSYDATAVPSVTLAPAAHTQIFVPQRHYSIGYKVQAKNARVVSAAGAPWIEIVADAGAHVEVSVTPDTGGQTSRPLQTAAFTQAVSSAAADSSSHGGAFAAPGLILLLALRRKRAFIPSVATDVAA